MEAFYNKYKYWIWGIIGMAVVITLIILGLRFLRKRQQAALDKAEKDSPVSFDHISADLEKRAAIEKVLLLADTLQERLNRLDAEAPPTVDTVAENSLPQAPQAPQPQELTPEPVGRGVVENVVEVKEAVNEVVEAVAIEEVKPEVKVLPKQVEVKPSLEDYLTGGVSNLFVAAKAVEVVVVEPVKDDGNVEYKPSIGDESVTAIEAAKGGGIDLDSKAKSISASDKAAKEFHKKELADDRAFQRAEKLNTVASWTHFLKVVQVKDDLKKKAKSYLSAAKKAAAKAKAKTTA